MNASLCYKLIILNYIFKNFGNASERMIPSGEVR